MSTIKIDEHGVKRTDTGLRIDGLPVYGPQWDLEWETGECGPDLIFFAPSRCNLKVERGAGWVAAICGGDRSGLRLTYERWMDGYAPSGMVMSQPVEPRVRESEYINLQQLIALWRAGRGGEWLAYDRKAGRYSEPQISPCSRSW